MYQNNMEVELLGLERAVDYRHGQFTYDGSQKYVLTFAITKCTAKVHDVIEAIRTMEDGLVLHEFVNRDGVFNVAIIVPEEWMPVENKLIKTLASLKGGPIKNPDAKVEDLINVEPLQLYIGYGLVEMAMDGSLLEMITEVRNQIALHIGLPIPSICIRDNLELQPKEYMLIIRDSLTSTGTIEPNMVLAVTNDHDDCQPLEGLATTDIYGRPAYWITSDQKSHAEEANWCLVEPANVIATHLHQLINTNAEQFLSLQITSNLLENLKQKAPTLIAEVVPNQIRLSTLQQILRHALRLQYSIRDLELILETIAINYPEKDVDILTAYVLEALDGEVGSEVKQESRVLN